MPQFTSTSYSRRTITGGRKTVSYSSNGRTININKGRVRAVGRAGATAVVGAGSAKVTGVLGGGNVQRTVKVVRRSGNGRVRTYTVSRARGTNMRQARAMRASTIRSSGATATGRVNRAVRFGSGSKSGKIRVAGKGGGRRPPQLSTAQRAAIARKRSRDSRGKFR